MEHGQTPEARQVVPPRTRVMALLPHRGIVVAGLLVGIAGNILVRSPQDPGLNMVLFFGALALAIGAVSRMAGRPPSREAWSWILGGILLSSAFVLRASTSLQFGALLAAAAAFALPSLRSGAAWMRGSGVADHLEAVAGSVVYAGLGALRLATDTFNTPDSPTPTVPGASSEPHRPGVSSVLRGLLLGAPLLLVFGALFVSADRVFADLVTGFLGTALEDWASHVVVTAILAWLATGYLTGFLTGTRMRDMVLPRMRRPSLGIVEIGVALSLVSVLFTAFIAVQFRYLFGGAGLVEVTPGLTYAEYAREGFGQLALASALVIPTLLVSDWLLGRPGPRARAVFLSLGSLQLLLLVLVIVSALQRVRAYQDAYGLTESRFYGVAFLGWLVLLSAWFGITVLRGRRERFAFPALLSGVGMVVALVVVNPDAWIARANLSRGVVALESTQERATDIDYLVSLGADAVPTLLGALPGLPPEARCRLAGRLLERWGTEREADWRSWNFAIARATHRVRTEAPYLERIMAADRKCDPDASLGRDQGYGRSTMVYRAAALTASVE